jgi:citrate synthase
MAPTPPAKGLADVVAASTALSDIDGKAGRLCYRGYDSHDLAGKISFIEQHADNRLIRPDCEYIGERDQKWTPIAERGQKWTASERADRG